MSDLEPVRAINRRQYSKGVRDEKALSRICCLASGDRQRSYERVRAGSDPCTDSGPPDSGTAADSGPCH